jgi:PAS domain S-box-containing protein
MSAPYSVLIVEDDPGFSSYLKRLLRREDLKLITASSGRQAIEYLEQHTVDIVLQDIGLPDIDGYQVMDQIRQQFPEVLIIVMTGEVTVESAVQALRKGAYDYLRKPFESMDLVNTVENALDRIRLEQKNRQAEEKLRESEERYRQLFESESDAVLIFDAETLKLEDANQAAADLFGYSKRQFLNLSLLDISAEKQKTEKHAHLLREDRSTINPVPMRYLVRKDGSTFPAEISTGTFVSGGRKKIIGAVRDISACSMS